MQLSTKKKEWLIIIVGWVLVFASVPLYMSYAMVSIGEEFSWSEIGLTWAYTSSFLLIFLLHHFVLVPQLVVKKHIGLYVASIIVIMGLFIGYMSHMAPNKPRFMHEHPEISETDMAQRPTVKPEPRPRHPMENENQPQHFLLAPPDLARLVITLLMLGVDLGVIAWFNEQKMRQRLLLLEQQNLKQELEHLRYQINPHFFMNTLNNIHVLVDLDQECAKRAIVELSGMMRYALYEGDGSLVPLYHEMDFLQSYISLMKLRFNNKVEVLYEMPENTTSDVQILPLLLPTFVENAFKHGISYLEHSFIHVSLKVDQEKQQILFSCINSRHPKPAATTDGHHGIGLENVKKRLELKYADTYQLHIDESDAKLFKVDLMLPIL